MTGWRCVYICATSFFSGSIGAAALGFGLEVADASMVTLLAMSVRGGLAQVVGLRGYRSIFRGFAKVQSDVKGV